MQIVCTSWHGVWRWTTPGNAQEYSDPHTRTHATRARILSLAVVDDGMSSSGAFSYFHGRVIKPASCQNMKEPYNVCIRNASCFVSEGR